MGQLEAHAAWIHPGNTIQECHLLGPGCAAIAAPAVALAHVLGFLLPSQAGWECLCQGPEGACAKQELAGFTQPDRP